MYTVNWRSVSAVDGHVENGAFAFGVGVAPAPGSVRTVDLLNTSPWVSALAAVGRWLLYVGLALFVGAAATCLLVFARQSPGRRHAAAAGGRRAWPSSGLCAMVWAERALVGAPSLLPLFQTRGGPVPARPRRRPRRSASSPSCAVDLWPARWTLALLGAAGAAAVLVHCLAGHADAPSAWRVLNVAAQWVHMTGIGVWVGGLAWLLLGIRGHERRPSAPPPWTPSRGSPR